MSADSSIEIQEVNDSKEAEQLLNFAAPAMIITSDATKCVTILANCKALIKNTRSKVILTGRKMLQPKVSKKLDSLGLASYILEPITTKSLHYKVNFILKSLPVKSLLANESGDKNKTVTIKTGDAQNKDDDANNEDHLAVKKFGNETPETEAAAQLNITAGELANSLTDAELQVQSKQSVSLDLISDEGIQSAGSDTIAPFKFDDEPEIKSGGQTDNTLFGDDTSLRTQNVDLKLELEPDDPKNKNEEVNLDLTSDMKAKGALDLKLDFEDESAKPKALNTTEEDFYQKKKAEEVTLDIDLEEFKRKNGGNLFDAEEMAELQKAYQDHKEEQDRRRKKNIDLGLEADDLYKKKEQVEGASIDYGEFEVEQEEETLKVEKKKRKNLEILADEEEKPTELSAEEALQQKKKRTDLGLMADEEAATKKESAPAEEFAREEKVDLTLEEEIEKKKKVHLEVAPEEAKTEEERAAEETAKKEKTAKVDLELAPEEKEEKNEELTEEAKAKNKENSDLGLEADKKTEESSPLDLDEADTKSDDSSVLNVERETGDDASKKQQEEGETFKKPTRDTDLELQGDLPENVTKGFKDDAGIIQTDNNVLDLNKKPRDKDLSRPADSIMAVDKNGTATSIEKAKVGVEFLTNPEVFNPKNVDNLNSNNIPLQNREVFNPTESDNAPIIKTHEDNRELQNLTKETKPVDSIIDLKPLDEIDNSDEYYEVYPDVYRPDSNGLEFSVILLEKILNKNVDTLKILAAISQIIFKTKAGITSFFYLDINFNGASSLLINHTNPQFAPYSMTEEQWIEYREFNLARYKKAIYPTLLNRKLNAETNELVFPIFDGKTQKGFVVINFYKHIKIEDIRFCENLLDSVKELIIFHLKKQDQPFTDIKSV